MVYEVDARAWPAGQQRAEAMDGVYLRRSQDRRCSSSDDVVEKGVCIHRQPTGCIFYPCSSFWYQSLSLTSVRARARGSVFYYML